MTLIFAFVFSLLSQASARHVIKCGSIAIYPELVRPDDGVAIMTMDYRSWWLNRPMVQTTFGTVLETKAGYHAYGEFHFGSQTYVPTLDIVRGPMGELKGTLHHFDGESGDSDHVEVVQCVETRSSTCEDGFGRARLR